MQNVNFNSNIEIDIIMIFDENLVEIFIEERANIKIGALLIL
jgi:hypothetical protein